MNDTLMGILQLRNLSSLPYVSLQTSLRIHEVSSSGRFDVLGSDGLFDFFCNDEVVKLVHSYILQNPSGDPAKFLVQQLAARAAKSAGFSIEELLRLPAVRRRKYHDDVTVRHEQASFKGIDVYLNSRTNHIFGGILGFLLPSIYEG